MHIPRGLLILDEVSVSADILLHLCLGILRLVFWMLKILCRSGIVTHCYPVPTTMISAQSRVQRLAVNPKSFE